MLTPGDMVYGFAWGHFGRDSYGDKECIHVGYCDSQRYAVFYERGGYGNGFHTLAGTDLEDLEGTLEREGQY
jgi:hypothetical protein